MKYKLTKNTKVVDGVTLYQIEALQDFGNVKKGDIGGWVESVDNLSQDGDCWVAGNARVHGDALVYDNARVYGNALVYGNARVYDNARVSGNARVCGTALVLGNARVSGTARVYGHALVSGTARVHHNKDITKELAHIKKPYSIEEIIKQYSSGSYNAELLLQHTLLLLTK